MAENKKKFSFSTMNFKDIPMFVVSLFKGELKEPELMSAQTGKYEINLVPDVKSGMIKTQKLRNIVFFICIIVIAATLTITAVLASVKTAQEITISSQDAHLKNLSDKVLSYKELPQFLTIQNQLKGISDIEDETKVLSRIFMLINSFLPDGNDIVTLSELAINLETTTLSFDAYANAGEEPNIDYRVLESFMKRANLMSFDYGRYVDENGDEIPSRCIEEYDSSSNMYQENGSVYAIWHRGNKGCDPSRDDFVKNSDSEESSNNVATMNSDKNDATIINTLYDGSDAQGFGVITDRSDKITYDGVRTVTATVVPDEKIYRTPQFTKWYKGESYDTATDGIGEEVDKDGNVTKKLESDDLNNYTVLTYNYKPQMDLDGSISGIPHFESRCITYSGMETYDNNGNESVEWSADNNCKLVPEGINVSDSSNGRDSDDNLVLSFSASITVDPAVFAYRNKHVMAIGPNGQNVTDSYVQLESIFSAPATKCDSSDSECIGNIANKVGSN